MTEIAALITARKNSKRVPGKNMKHLWDEPLISHTFKAALGSKLIGKIFLTTDDHQIIEYAAKFPGIEVPFIRPSELAEDNSTDIEVFNHALNFFKMHDYKPEILVHLRPTSPLRTSTHIDSAIKLMLANPDATSVRSVRKIDHSIFKLYFLREKFLEFLDANDISNARDMPNQILPETYAHIGYVDIVKASTILELKSMTGNKIMPFIINNGEPGINYLKDFDYYESLK